MNFYAFHIGDYASATRHLTWEEDCAYRRLLDVYYTREEPFPDDMRAICRLVVASTPEQRQAVEVVLHEFFVLTDDGWISPRADREIDSMRVKQTAQGEKAQHESERMRRYRERRAAMFDALRERGIVPAWDVSVKELQRLHKLHCNVAGPEPETDLQREQVVSGDAPATAISTNPITNTNTKVDTPLTPQGAVGGAQPPTNDPPEPHELPRPGGDNSHPLAGTVCQLMKRLGVGLVNPGNAKLNALLNAGSTVGQFEDAAHKALAAGKSFSYALGIVEREEREARALGAQLQKPRVAAQPVNRQEALEARNRAVGDAWLQKMQAQAQAQAQAQVQTPMQTQTQMQTQGGGHAR